MPMIPITPKVVNAISMFVIFVHLPVKQMPEGQKNQCNHKPYPQGLQRELVGYEVSDDGNSHYKLAYIIAILGEVVYLLFVHHKDVSKATGVQLDIGQ